MILGVNMETMIGKHFIENKLATGGEPSTWFPPGGLVETAGVTEHDLYLRFKAGHPSKSLRIRIFFKH